RRATPPAENLLAPDGPGEKGVMRRDGGCFLYRSRNFRKTGVAEAAVRHSLSAVFFPALQRLASDGRTRRRGKSRWVGRFLRNSFLRGAFAETVRAFCDCSGFRAARLGGHNSTLTLADKGELVVLAVPIDSYEVAYANLLGRQQIRQRVYQVALDCAL